MYCLCPITYPVGWGCKIHRLLFYKEVGHPPTSYLDMTQSHRSTLGCGCRIHRLHLCRDVWPTYYECPAFDPKQSDCEVAVMLELWGMQITISLPSLPGLLWPGVVAFDRVLSMSQTEQNCVLMLNWTAWNRTVLKFKLRTYAKLNCLK